MGTRLAAPFLSFPTSAAYHAYHKISTKIGVVKSGRLRPACDPFATGPLTPDPVAHLNSGYANSCQSRCAAEGKTSVGSPGGSGARDTLAGRPASRQALAQHGLAGRRGVPDRVALGHAPGGAALQDQCTGRGPAAWLLVGMLFVPLYLFTGAWDAGFGIQGWHTLVANPHLAHQPWLAGWRAAVWVHGLAAVPWVVLIVGAGLRAVEAEIEEDAATCATPLQVLWHISIRRAAPALAIAAVWIVTIVMTEISVTDFFQVRTFAEEVYTQSALGTFDAVGPIERCAVVARTFPPLVCGADSLLLPCCARSDCRRPAAVCRAGRCAATHGLGFGD